ncbi:hypothetical protein [Desulfosporosinus sp. BG]|uniref:hypothetical protein n=1 Tax=Desulfosporosinus sp. BG TaxID=1633135 RepID=UPI000839FEA7|nr:hypothetical protein [Desulfosporosinus sp. BG]ODA42500.1 hypothetical protein DSBG_0640 [Desulfosporosinus sp. BG]
MSVQHSESKLFQVWALRLAIITTFIVVLLSWLNGVRIFDLIVRAGVSFGVIYLLMVGTYSLFERTAPPKPEDEHSDSGRGGFIDISVGDDQLHTSPVQDSRFPGQVDQDLSAGLPDSERQAEIVRRMGWE